MLDAGQASERALVSQIVDDYRRMGYDVALEPELKIENLPKRLANFRPDAIARKGGETIVIEIKRTKSRPSQSVLRALNKIINGRSGWRLNVVWAVPEDNLTIKVSSRSELKKQLSSVDKLFADGQRGAAFLLLWSMLEAALHQKLKQLGIDRSHPQGATALTKDLISYGFVKQEAYADLQQLVKHRNALVHGNPTAKIDKQSFGRLKAIVEILLR